MSLTTIILIILFFIVLFFKPSYLLADAMNIETNTKGTLAICTGLGFAILLKYKYGKSIIFITAHEYDRLCEFYNTYYKGES